MQNDLNPTIKSISNTLYTDVSGNSFDRHLKSLIFAS